FPGGSAGLPTRSNGLTVSSYTNLFQTVQLNGANFLAGSAVDPGNATLAQATLVASSWSNLTTFAKDAYVYIDEAAHPAPPAPVVPPAYHFFRSLVAGNLNHPPATSAAQWVEVPRSEVESWQPTVSYASGAFTNAGGVIYQSKVASNLNHPPATSPTQ